ncbi:MAG TPA: DUF6629 family protein [Ferruginibacter sp.]|nr:DUF6629 family protein [Ferruginibacter sp.]
MLFRHCKFWAGVVLAAIGIASIKKVNHPSQILFAAIPLIFCVQQVTEGFLWLGFAKPDYASLQQFTTNTFLFIAQVVWPLCVPLSILLLEKNKKRIMGLKLLVAAGAVVSIYLGYCLLTYPVNAKIIGYHISYGQVYPVRPAGLIGMLYIIATIAPAFFSGIKRMWYLGVAILISYIMTKIFYTDYIVSVWCFFASVISIVVLAIMYKMTRPVLRLV